MTANVYESLPTSSVAIHMVAGAFAGIMEHCVMYPIDSAKTRMQALIPGPGGGGGIVTVLSRMVREESLRRPFRGMSAVVAGAGPAHALYFSCYEYLKDLFITPRSPAHLNIVAYASAACVATVLHDGIMNPAEVVKQRLQMYNSPYRHALKCMQDIYRKEGAYAFYRSYTTQLAISMPFQAIHFITYELAQEYTNPQHTYNPKAHMISGAAAGAVAAAVTTPFDVCKTFLNTQSDTHVQGMRDAIKQVYNHGGVSTFFRGLTARVLYQIPATTICWSAYEFLKYVLVHNEMDDHCGHEADNDLTGANQNQSGSTRSSRFQDVSLYLKKSPPTSVLLEVTPS